MSAITRPEPLADSEPPVRSGRTRMLDLARRRRSLFTTLISIVVGLGVWEVVAHNTSPLVTAPIEDIWDAFFHQIHAHTLWPNLRATLVPFVIGFAVSVAGGIAVGLIISSSKIVFELFDPWISALRSTPLITIIPLIIVEFGIGIKAKVVIVVIIAIFPIILNTADGVRSAERGLIDVAYAFGANRRQIFTRVLIPSALPFIIGGVRISVNAALVAVVVAEFFGSREGVGYMTFQASQVFETATVYLGIAILIVIGVIASRLTYVAERLLMPWRKFDIAKQRGA